MIPLALDPAQVRIALAGSGPLAARRLVQLRDGGADLLVYSLDEDGEFAALAGSAAIRRLPEGGDFDRFQVLYVVGLDNGIAEPLAGTARARRVLVNVEDVVPLCDFHSPSVVRRGELLLTISTGGRSPTLASLLRQRLEALFPDTWGERLQRIAELRGELKAKGAGMSEIAAATKALVAREGWLP